MSLSKKNYQSSENLWLGLVRPLKREKLVLISPKATKPGFSKLKRKSIDFKEKNPIFEKIPQIIIKISDLYHSHRELLFSCKFWFTGLTVRLRPEFTIVNTHWRSWKTSKIRIKFCLTFKLKIKIYNSETRLFAVKERVECDIRKAIISQNVNIKSF